MGFKDDIELLKEAGFKTGAEKLDEYKNRRVYYCPPLSLSLATARRDPITGMPGFPRGLVMEVAGAPQKTKSALAEQFAVSIHKEDSEAVIIFLNFEAQDIERLNNLFNNGLDQDRTVILDYSNPKLHKAEDGLYMVLDAAKKCSSVALVIIDSFGAMAVEKEVLDEKGEFKELDAKQQAALRASRAKSFLDKWNTLNQNIRPILCVVNHMRDQLKMDGGFGVDPLKVAKIGEDLNYTTPAGTTIDFYADVRIRADAKKWPEPKDVEKHEVVDQKIYDALEVYYEIYKNKLLPGRHWARSVYNMEDRAHCHFEEESNVLNACSYLGICNVIKQPKKRWEIDGKSYTHEGAVKYLKENPELMRSMIIECAKPGNPERFHAQKGKMKPLPSGADKL